MDDRETMAISVSYAGQRQEVPTSLSQTVGELSAELAGLFGVDPLTVKLLRPKGKAPLVPSAEAPETLARDLGIFPGMKLMLVASKAGQVEHIKRQREVPRMRGFEQEAALYAARTSRPRRGADAPPKAKYTFGRYEVWQHPGLHPPPSAAMKLLYRLASDRGILGIMDMHKWEVGLLKEMPPEGKVGVSPVCVLGLNVNRGQEIHLRLRTDDLKGFRRYRAIRDTLCHELAHMVFSEHDSDFKNLNSKLMRECNAMSWTHGISGGLRLTTSDTYTSGGTDDEDDGAQLVGAPRKLRDGADPTSSSGYEHWDAATAAAEAAMRRLGGLDPERQPADTEDAMDPPKPSDHETRDHEPLKAAEPTEVPEEALAESCVANMMPVEDSTEDSQPEVPPAVAMDVFRESTGGLSLSDAATGGPTCLAGLYGAQSPLAPANEPAPEVTGTTADEGVPESAAQQRYREFETYLNRLVGNLSLTEVPTVLETLEKVLANALEKPTEDRFRQLRCGNKAFQNRIGRYQFALHVLQAAGFSYIGPGQQGTTAFGPSDLRSDGMLCLRRDDPGLLWLALSAVRTAKQSTTY